MYKGIFVDDADIEEVFYPDPLIFYSVSTTVGAYIDNTTHYGATGNNARAASSVFYAVKGGKKLTVNVESNYQVYIMQHSEAVEGQARTGVWQGGTFYFDLAETTNFIRLMARRTDGADLSRSPSISISVDNGAGYVTPQMFKTSSNTWNDAFDSCMATGKLIYVPEGFYELDRTININKNGVCIKGAGYNTVINPPVMYNDDTDGNHREDENQQPLPTAPIESDALKYTYAFTVQGVTGVRLSDFRIQAQTEQTANDVCTVLGHRGCGIKTIKGENVPSRNCYSNLWIEGCTIGIAHQAVGSMFSNITVHGLPEYSDMTRAWKNWHSGGRSGTEPTKYIHWKSVGIINAGTDSFFSDCVVGWNHIGIFCYSGSYFTNCKTFVNHYGCIVGQTDSSIGCNLVTNSAKICTSLEMSNCYFQEQKGSNLMLFNASNCNIQAYSESAGDTYANTTDKALDYINDDIDGYPISNLYINSVSYSDIDITTKLCSAGGYERYEIYCAANRTGFNDIKMKVCPPATPLGHRFDMIGGKRFGLFGSEVTINGMAFADTGARNKISSTSIITTGLECSVIPECYICFGDESVSNADGWAVKITIINPAVNDIIALPLGNCHAFGGSFVVQSDDLLSGLDMKVFAGTVSNNTVQIADQTELYSSGINSGGFGTQTGVYFGRDMGSTAYYCIVLKITALPVSASSVAFTISDFNFGII